MVEDIEILLLVRYRSKSVQRFQRSGRKWLIQSDVGRSSCFFPIGPKKKKTHLADGVEILLPINFRLIPFSGFRKFENVLDLSSCKVSINSVQVFQRIIRKLGRLTTVDGRSDGRPTDVGKRVFTIGHFCDAQIWHLHIHHAFSWFTFTWHYHKCHFQATTSLSFYFQNGAALLLGPWASWYKSTVEYIIRITTILFILFNTYSLSYLRYQEISSLPAESGGRSTISAKNFDIPWLILIDASCERSEIWANSPHELEVKV